MSDPNGPQKETVRITLPPRPPAHPIESREPGKSICRRSRREWLRLDPNVQRTEARHAAAPAAIEAACSAASADCDRASAAACSPAHILTAAATTSTAASRCRGGSTTATTSSSRVAAGDAKIAPPAARTAARGSSNSSADATAASSSSAAATRHSAERARRVLSRPRRQIIPAQARKPDRKRKPRALRFCPSRPSRPRR